MPMFQKYKLLTLAILAVIQVAQAEPPSSSNGVRPSNVLGGLEQHASFSFVRPGLTQTAFAFNGPSSHQAFSSSVGDPHLAQRVLPSVANALAYRNPGLGYSPVSPITTAYAAGPQPAAAAAPIGAYQQQQHDYQHQQQDLALIYQQQIQQYQQYQLQQQQYQQQYQQQQQQHQQYQQQYQQQQQQQIYPGYTQQVQAEPIDAATQQNAEQQAHLARLVASRFAGSHVQPVSTDTEQIQLQQQQQVQQQQQNANLLGVAYSSAPSVAHVKVSGNGYKFDF